MSAGMRGLRPDTPKVTRGSREANIGKVAAVDERLAHRHGGGRLPGMDGGAARML
jgi:hypothetical protein